MEGFVKVPEGSGEPCKTVATQDVWKRINELSSILVDMWCQRFTIKYLYPGEICVKAWRGNIGEKEFSGRDKFPDKALRRLDRMVQNELKGGKVLILRTYPSVVANPQKAEFVAWCVGYVLDGAYGEGLHSVNDERKIHPRR